MAASSFMDVHFPPSPPLSRAAVQATADMWANIVRLKSVHVVSATWARESHDLFDFEAEQAEQIHKKSFMVTDSSTCVRVGSEVCMLKACDAAPPNSDYLVQFIHEGGSFWVDRAASPAVPGASRRLWLVVRDLATKGHQLTEGDMIKLGRFKFRVRQLCTKAEEQPDIRAVDDKPPCLPAVPRDPANAMCRICLDGPCDDDPLFSPCACRGSIEYVHLGCLRRWVSDRLGIRPDGGESSFFYPKLSCELCHENYPSHIKCDGETTPLVLVPHIRPPFVVLEQVGNPVQGVHVVSMASGRELTLGRGHSSDVRIADVSISRLHAVIRLSEGSFVLEDRGSKFGTLVALRKAQALDTRAPLSLQVGRTVLNLSIEGPSNTSADDSQSLPWTGNVNTRLSSMRLSYPFGGRRGSERSSQSPAARNRRPRQQAEDAPSEDFASTNGESWSPARIRGSGGRQ